MVKKEMVKEKLSVFVNFQKQTTCDWKFLDIATEQGQQNQQQLKV